MKNFAGDSSVALIPKICFDIDIDIDILIFKNFDIDNIKLIKLTLILILIFDISITYKNLVIKIMLCFLHLKLMNHFIPG